MTGMQPTAPVFVFGALRSGTTVFRLMLDAHPHLNNPGEVDYLFDTLHRDASQPRGWRYDFDDLLERRGFLASGLTIPSGKDGIDLLEDFLDQFRARKPGQLTLNIHRNLGKALEVLPRSRVIHILRDPRDVARSCIGMGWAGTLYHGISQWIETEKDWEDAAPGIDRSKHIQLTYEDLIRDTQGELARVCDFLGVAFEPQMLRYHENTTYSAPDLSLIEQWRRKSSAKELAQVEYRVARMMQDRGYQLSQPVIEPGGVQLLLLSMVNRSRRWRMAIDRYGVGLFLQELLTRRLGLRGLHRHFAARKRALDTEYLK